MCFINLVSEPKEGEMSPWVAFEFRVWQHKLGSVVKCKAAIFCVFITVNKFH